jgi:hypothetical protein
MLRTLHCVVIVVTAVCWLGTVTRATALDRVVSTTAQFSLALDAAEPGDRILLQPGVYGGGHYRANLRDVHIRSIDPANRAIFDGGANAIQLSDAQNVTISDLEFRNQTGNGLNIDDGGSFDTPTTGLTLRNITVRDIANPGNRDGIKLSGVTGFLIDGVRVHNWGTGGSAVDMVGCHHGLVQNSLFAHTNEAFAGTTLQPKGGSKHITFRANRIELPRGSGRAVQAGGSTGAEFFRFIDGDSGYEADGITAEGNVIAGGMSAFSWVNIDGGVFHHNFANRPGNWVARILNENQGNAIVDTQNGQFHDNGIVYNDTSSELSTTVNVGAETVPSSYTFARNRWLNLANPTAAGSTPTLPTAEQGGTYGDRSLNGQLDHAIAWDFAWGIWIVNANAGPDSIDIPDFATLRRAAPGESAEFRPLEADPLEGQWTAAALPAATIELPAFSHVVLIDPQACPNCFGLAGDYNQDALVDQGDYQSWRAAFGTAGAAADGNGDGIVDAADYVVWRRTATATDSLVHSAMANSMIIPEPHSVWLTISGIALVRLPRPHREAAEK